jgi:nitrite reductase/ring-hydroxylating ferredoxin subunit
MQWHRVADASALPQRPGARIHCKVGGRHISVLRSKADPGRLYCLDSICYHMGGPLTVGDIEDYAGHECIVCPWHHYAVTLDTGAKMYQSLAMIDGKMCPGDWKANCNQQRTHPVEIRVCQLLLLLLLCRCKCSCCLRCRS